MNVTLAPKSDIGWSKWLRRVVVEVKPRNVVIALQHENESQVDTSLENPQPIDFVLKFLSMEPHVTTRVKYDIGKGADRPGRWWLQVTFRGLRRRDRLV